eukprot:TRINITY_DN10186_c0_g3_i1.p1 TRINITY_DN10186_c0_g3~~TRINITY_DN10186_c0_g3_i1.p1  ORF type:complete len:104 (+),score=20.66 TRINITY_DN10186_c0_g3_i1:200-511(+)
MMEFMNGSGTFTENQYNQFERQDFDWFLSRKDRRWNVIDETDTFFYAMGDPDSLDKIFREIVQKKPSLFCLNDNIPSLHLNRTRTVFNKWMQVLFPVPAEFEL